MDKVELIGCGKTLHSSFNKPRANGSSIKIVGGFPFGLSLSKHEHHFFSSLLQVGYHLLGEQFQMFQLVKHRVQ